MEIYVRNSLLVQKVINGYRINTKGTQEMQEDNADGEYVFASLETLLEWIKEYYKRLK